MVRDDAPTRPSWWRALIVALNVAAVAFVAWVGYERSGVRGALILTAVALAVAWGFRRAGTAADRVSRRGGRPPAA